MTRMFAGKTIPGLLEAQQEVLADCVVYTDRDVSVPGGRLTPGLIMAPDNPRCPNPIRFDDLDRAVAEKGIDHPKRREHLLWLSVNDPRVVNEKGKVIRGMYDRYLVPAEERP